MKKLYIALLICLGAYACGTSRQSSDSAGSIPPPPHEDTAVSFENTNEMTAIEEGEALYNNQCTLCHEAKNIKDFTYEEWVPIVADMSKKVNKKLKSEDIDALDEANLLRYIHYELEN